MAGIIVTDYDPDWPKAFERLKARIWPAIQGVAESIEHVGSTSVEGLAAKPIIDMTIVVPREALMPKIIDRLAGIGYRHRGDLGVRGREAFARPDKEPADPAHHLYACAADGLALRNHLAIRDHLRRHPRKAEAYGRLKKKLAAEFLDDIDAYIDGKTDFIIRILAEAGFTQDELREIQTINAKPSS